ncbi:sugar ABC transporter permease [candidate division KSB3 bacterium]|uniref:Sugar ABC transporter permease n=1 Tax=candidate division KSB3 bacterium TaxID=2044937 RepID=A0A2G6KKG6_9BACT|nr:MAG: sugar ABC transporter permease [candidate division KSB3 bacterium]
MAFLNKNTLHPLTSYKTRRSIAPYMYLAPTIFLLAILMVLPMIIVVRYSLLDNVIMNKHPVFVGLQNYKSVFANETFRLSVGNTMYFTIMSVTFHLLLGLSFALLLNSKLINHTARSILRVFYIMPWVFTATIIAIIWRLLLNPVGIINYILTTLSITSSNIEWLSSSNTAIHAVTFINIWAGYPFYMVSLLAGLQGVPGELYEAAVIDGANDVQKFRHITIPHLVPIIVSIAMLDFIWTMQVFPLIWMTTGGGPIHATEMLSTFTYKLAFSRYQFSLASASAVIVLILSMGVALFYVRHQKVRD